MAVSADVVVIGAGIIGCASAYFLARDGYRVILVERGEVASGTASASGGWVIIQDKDTPAAVALARASRKLYDSLQEELGFALHPTGGLIVATDDAESARLRRQAATATAGGACVDLLDVDVLRHLEPALAADLPAGLFCSEEATVDPEEVCHALVRGTVASGGRVWTSSPVVGITVQHGRITEVATSKERIETATVVCACGAWSPEVARLVGVAVAVIPRRGHIVVTEPQALVRRPVLEAGYLDGAAHNGEQEEPYGLRFVLQPAGDAGNLVGSSREFRGFDREPDPDLTRQLWARAFRFVPALGRTRIARTLVGFRPYTPSRRPIIGWAGPAGFLVATGHEGEGVTLAPVTGKMVSDLVAGRMKQSGFEVQ